MAFIVALLAAFLAFGNGANDNGKGVATLVGLGHATPRRALAWATITTLLGSIISFGLAAGLVDKFSGAVLGSKEPLGPTFFAAVLIAASTWIIIATVTGMPVS